MKPIQARFPAQCDFYQCTQPVIVRIDDGKGIYCDPTMLCAEHDKEYVSIGFRKDYAPEGHTWPHEYSNY